MATINRIEVMTAIEANKGNLSELVVSLSRLGLLSPQINYIIDKLDDKRSTPKSIVDGIIPREPTTKESTVSTTKTTTKAASNGGKFKAFGKQSETEELRVWHMPNYKGSRMIKYRHKMLSLALVRSIRSAGPEFDAFLEACESGDIPECADTYYVIE